MKKPKPSVAEPPLQPQGAPSTRVNPFLRKHGLRGTHIYEVWLGIKKRCFDSSRKDYPHYGGRGITMHAPWIDDVALFAAETSKGYSPSLTIDRINNEGHYEPENIRWISHSEQMRNRRNNAIITHGGKTMCAAEWDRALGLKRGSITRRMHRTNATAEEAFRYFLNE